MKPLRGFENLENNTVSIDMFSLREKTQSLPVGHPYQKKTRNHTTTKTP